VECECAEASLKTNVRAISNAEDKLMRTSNAEDKNDENWAYYY
jgi:hypothetical protein